MLYCKSCAAAHPGMRGGPEELVLYSVMLLDATEKSFFCDPACYERYNRERKDCKHDVFCERPAVRMSWRERSVAMKLALKG